MAALGYVIKFVDDMDQNIAFYRDVVGLELRFQSPEWSEFSTGSTTLALHYATPESPAGTIKLGLNVKDLDAFHARLSAKSVTFTRQPVEQHGQRLAEFIDPFGVHVSVSSPLR